MKANNIEGKIITFDQLPADWKNVLNFPAASEEVHREFGFFNVVTPVIDGSLQRLGEIFFDVTNQVFTYPVIDKTVQELATEKESLLQGIERRADIASIKKLLAILTKDILNDVNVTQDKLDAIVTVHNQYRVGKSYVAGEIFVYENTLYEVVQPHTSQSDWVPGVARSLYKKFTPAGVIDPWVQPLGSFDAYTVGVKVTHGGFTWQNNTVSNVWEPGVYGWTKI